MPVLKPAKKSARPSAKAEAARVQEIFDRFAARDDHPKTELNYSSPFTLVVAVAWAHRATATTRGKGLE